MLSVLGISENITKTDGTSGLAASLTALLTRQQGSWTAEKGSSLRFFRQKMNLRFKLHRDNFSIYLAKARLEQ